MFFGVLFLISCHNIPCLTHKIEHCPLSKALLVIFLTWTLSFSGTGNLEGRFSFAKIESVNYIVINGLDGVSKQDALLTGSAKSVFCHLVKIALGCFQC